MSWLGRGSASDVLILGLSVRDTYDPFEGRCTKVHRLPKVLCSAARPCPNSDSMTGLLGGGYRNAAASTNGPNSPNYSGPKSTCAQEGSSCASRDGIEKQPPASLIPQGRQARRKGGREPRPLPDLPLCCSLQQPRGSKTSTDSLWELENYIGAPTTQQPTYGMLSTYSSQIHPQAPVSKP